MDDCLNIQDIVVDHQYRLKGGTFEALTIKNPILARREPCVAFMEDGSIMLKIGDGERDFNTLPFVTSFNDANDSITFTKEDTDPTTGEIIEEKYTAKFVIRDNKPLIEYNLV